MTDRPRRHLRSFALALVAALALAACTGSPEPPTTTAPTSPAGAVLPDLTVAFVEDLSPDGAEQRVAPAFQGARLAVDTATLRGELPASVRIVPMDTGGTPDGVQTVAERIVGDPTVVAAVVGPQLTGQITLGDRLDAAGVPVVSLSTAGPDLAAQGWRWWRRAVPDVDREAVALAGALEELAGARQACVLGDGSVPSISFGHAVVSVLPTRPALRLALPETNPDDPSVVSAVREAGCRSVIWSGTPAGGALLRLALVSSGLRSVRLFGGESLKDASYIGTAGPRGRGTIAVCPCVDVSTSTALRDRRFIQDYQSAFGVPPGPFASEGWDVAGMILDAIRTGSGTRAEVGAALDRSATYEGLARTYTFATDGTLQRQSEAVRVYRDEGVRWVEDPPTTRRSR